MEDFAILHQKFTEALLKPQHEVPEGLIAVKAPNIGRRFDVYRNNVMASLVDALKANFPIVSALVGDDFFSGLAVAYISDNPPVIPMLFKYGVEFPAFIAEYPSGASLPYLSDVARLENHWRAAYHAEEKQSIDITAVQKFSPEDQMNLVFEIHPSASILKSGWPIYSIWQGHESGDMGQINLETSENVVICRPQVNVMLASLNEDACVFFRQIMNGQTLGEAYGAAAEKNEEFDLSYSFGQLFAMGLVTGLSVKN
ncbi:MAG: putative DNA-binding domain-containing protein [Alphaproteobacteria bacterium]|nr:putative DNA-binding domain-containing protein [Alphaproteobacteria bacterium]